MVSFAVSVLLSGMMGSMPADPAIQARLLSPEVHADKTVTFRFRAPNAQRVSIDIEGNGRFDLTKDENGVWAGKSKTLVPDLYGYTVVMDGVGVLDPVNPVIKPNLIWASNLVLVPGDKPELWEEQDVPRGRVTRQPYRSKLIGDHREFLVYTPPGYDPAGSTRYPVLYLLHGFSDTAVGWTDVGRAHVILDNLLAQNRIKPMLVVMPLGYGAPDFGKNGKLQFGLAAENYAKFTQGLLEEVIPMVEKGFRVSPKREDRAIAGLSMGGAETLLTGLKNLDTFAYIGAFSTGGFPAPNIDAVFPNLDVKKANALKHFWVVCGTEDGLIGFQRGFVKWLTEKGVKHEVTETGGGHVWMLWRRNLATFAEKLFR